MERINRFSQGTIWYWSNSNTATSNNGSVQSDKRPILVISNNEFNFHSTVVNCLTITSILKDSPVHVPIYLNTMSHIQCEQIHTIPKKDLYGFRGVVSSITMDEVREKLKFQFSITMEKNSDLFMDIDMRIEKLSRCVESCSKETNSELYAVAMFKELLLSISQVRNEFSQLPINNITKDPTLITSETEQTSPLNVARMPTEDIKQSATPTKDNPNNEKHIRRTYTAEDKAFIIDKRNSIDTLVEKFGFKDKKTAYAARNYLRKRVI